MENNNDENNETVAVAAAEDTTSIDITTEVAGAEVNEDAATSAAENVQDTTDEVNAKNENEGTDDEGGEDDDEDEDEEDEDNEASAEAETAESSVPLSEVSPDDLLEKEEYPKLYKYVLDKVFNRIIRNIPHANEDPKLVEEINNWEQFLMTNKQVLDMAKSKKFARLMQIIKKKVRDSPMVAENNESLNLLKESAKNFKPKAIDYANESIQMAKDIHQTPTGQEIESKFLRTLKMLIHHPNSVDIMAGFRNRLIQLDLEAQKQAQAASDANAASTSTASASTSTGQPLKKKKRSIRQGWMDVLNKLIEALNESNPESNIAPGALAEKVILWFYGLQEEGASESAGGKADSADMAITKKDDLVRKNAKRIHKYIETLQERTKVKSSDALDGVVKMIPKAEEFIEKVAQRVRDMKSKGKFDDAAALALKQMTEDRRVFLERKINEVVPDEFVKYVELISNDGEARRKFIDYVKDETISLIVHYLPSINIPPLEGEKDGVNYVVKGLDLSGFQFTKENISVKLASIDQIQAGEPFVTLIVDDISAKMKDLEFNFQQTYFPFLKAEGNADSTVKGASFIVGLQVYRGFAHEDEDESSGTAGNNANEDGNSTADEDEVPSATSTAAASKRRLTGYPLEKGVQQIRDKYASGATPPPPGSSASPATVAKKSVEHPRFRVGIVRVKIDSIALNIHGTSMSWFYNGITDVFSHNIKTYIISLIQDGLEEEITKLTDAVSDEICERWKLITSSMEVDLQLLADEEKAVAKASQLYSGIAKRRDVYSVTFTNHGPLGIALAQKKEYVIVKGFRRLSNNQMLPGEKCGRIRPGDVLVGYNGQDIESLPLDRVHSRLKKSTRPLTLSFIPGTAFTAEGELKSVEESLAAKNAAAQKGGASASASAASTAKSGALAKLKSRLRARAGDQSNVDIEEPVSVTFKDPKLYMLIKARKDNAPAAVVSGFRLTEKGDQGPAEKCGKIKIGYILTKIGAKSTKNLTFDETFNLFKDAPRPITLEFMSDSDFEVIFNKDQPTDLKLSVFNASSTNNQTNAASASTSVVVTGFKHIPGPAESQCGDSISAGFIVSKIGDLSTQGMEFDTVISKLKDSVRPVTVVFTRDTKEAEADDEGSKVNECSATFQEGPLGTIFYRRPEDKKCCFKAFVEYPGPAKRAGKIEAGDVMLSINGNPVPSEEKEVEKMLQEAALPIILVMRDMAQYALLQEGNNA